MKKFSTKQVSFQVILCDCLVIEQYIEEETKYDRILTGNLLEYILLPRLLEICSRKIKHENPFATIVTQTQNWTQDFCPEADVQALDWFPPRLQLKKIGLEDTNNPQQVGSGNDIREYLHNFAKFVDFIRALSRAFMLKRGGVKAGGKMMLVLPRSLKFQLLKFWVTNFI